MDYKDKNADFSLNFLKTVARIATNEKEMTHDTFLSWATKWLNAGSSNRVDELVYEFTWTLYVREMYQK